MPGRFLKYVLVSAISLLSLSSYSAEGDNGNGRYQVQIDIREAYIGGICVMRNDGEYVTASIVNEFGVSALTCRYDLRKGKVRILGVAGPLNRPSVKRVLRSDMKVIMAQFCKEDFQIDDKYVYENSRYDILYTFKPMSYEITE